MVNRVNRVSRLRIQFSQKSGRLVLFLLFVLDYLVNQNKISMFARAVGVPRSCCIAAAKILEEYQRSFSSKIRAYGELPIIAILWRRRTLFPGG